MLPRYEDSRADMEALSITDCASVDRGAIVGVGFTFAAADTPHGASEWRWVRATVLANDATRGLLTVRVDFSGEVDVFAYSEGDDIAQWPSDAAPRCYCDAPAEFVNPPSDASPSAKVCEDHIADGYERLPSGNEITEAHVTEVLDTVRSSGLSAHATAETRASTPVLAVAIRHDLNPVALQAAVDRYADDQRETRDAARDCQLREMRRPGDGYTTCSCEGPHRFDCDAR